jgi:hypothetical protein
MAIPTDLPTAVPREAQAAIGGDADLLPKQPMQSKANGNEPYPPSSTSIASSAMSEEAAQEKGARPTGEAAAPQPQEQHLLLEHMEEIDLITLADQEQWLALMSAC